MNPIRRLLFPLIAAAVLVVPYEADAFQAPYTGKIIGEVRATTRAELQRRGVDAAAPSYMATVNYMSRFVAEAAMACAGFVPKNSVVGFAVSMGCLGIGLGVPLFENHDVALNKLDSGDFVIGPSGSQKNSLCLGAELTACELVPARTTANRLTVKCLAGGGSAVAYFSRSDDCAYWAAVQEGHSVSTMNPEFGEMFNIVNARTDTIIIKTNISASAMIYTPPIGLELQTRYPNITDETWSSQPYPPDGQYTIGSMDYTTYRVTDRCAATTKTCWVLLYKGTISGVHPIGDFKNFSEHLFDNTRSGTFNRSVSRRDQNGKLIHTEQVPFTGVSSVYRHHVVQNPPWSLTFNTTNDYILVRGPIVIADDESAPLCALGMHYQGQCQTPEWRGPRMRTIPDALPSAMDQLPERLHNEPLSPRYVATIVNQVWQAMQLQPGYDGEPYNFTSPMREIDVGALRRARPVEAIPTVRDLLAPAVPDAREGTQGQPQRGKIVFAPDVSDGYQTAEGLSLPPAIADPKAATAGTVAGIREAIGGHPAISDPVLEAPKTALEILEPILNLMPKLREIDLKGLNGQCPTFDLSFFFTQNPVKFDSHCKLFEEAREGISASFILLWSITALVILLSA